MILAGSDAPGTLTIGSRGSPLALWQARHVASLLEAAGVASRITVIRTTGDHLQTASLVQAGGKGLFTKEIEDALLAGTIDLAVHSLKDLPTEMPAGLVLAAIPEREDARDALIGKTLATLPEGARVGTSSLRRAAQLRALRPDCVVEAVRGNVDTRLRKLHGGEFDAILLAAAGLHRLGLGREIAQTLEPAQMCPAAGQGALAIQTRGGDDEAFRACCGLNHEQSARAVESERAALAELGGGCQLPVGAFAEEANGALRLEVMVASPDGRELLRVRCDGGAGESAGLLGKRAAVELIKRGATRLLEDVVRT